MSPDPLGGSAPSQETSRNPPAFSLHYPLLAMMASPKLWQPVLAFAARHLDGDVSLDALARHAGISRFQLHRLLGAAMGETPKHLTLRLRLARAAALLLTSRDSILDIALACGFQSHEVFCRAFRRRFGIAPRAYRLRGFAHRITNAQRAGHAAWVHQLGPCIGLYRVRINRNLQRSEMTYSITTKHLQPQPALVLRRRIQQGEIAAALADMYPQIFLHAQRSGIALAGQPFARYLQWGPGLLTLEAGFPVIAPNAPPNRGESAAPPGILVDSLPGGQVAVTTHSGPYENLREAHAALEQWIETQGLTPAGAPWEHYVTDPAEHPDPQDWKTDIYWPVRVA
jgi:AraC family transcriptional regulator